MTSKLFYTIVAGIYALFVCSIPFSIFGTLIYTGIIVEHSNLEVPSKWFTYMVFTFYFLHVLLVSFKEIPKAIDQFKEEKQSLT